MSRRFLFFCFGSCATLSVRACALSPLQSKLFPKSSPNPYECMHEGSDSMHTHTQVAEIPKKSWWLILNDVHLPHCPIEAFFKEKNLMVQTPPFPAKFWLCACRYLLLRIVVLNLFWWQSRIFNSSHMQITHFFRWRPNLKKVFHSLRFHWQIEVFFGRL